LKTIIYVTGLLALTVTYFIGLLGAQQPAPAATKVGVVNIGFIFSNYGKMKKLYEEIEPRSDEAEKLKKLIVDWQNALNAGKLTPAQTEQGKHTIADCMRRLEDMRSRYKDGLGKNTEDRLVVLYKEVNEEIRRVAVSQGYHLILGYGEPVDGNLFSIANVTRKQDAMDQGAIVPIYFAGWLDISPQVLANLNRGMAK